MFPQHLYYNKKKTKNEPRICPDLSDQNDPNTVNTGITEQNHKQCTKNITSTTS